jgi:hypothetical protein
VHCLLLNAPVLCFCHCSKISCSSFGRRGGAGKGDHEVRLLKDMLNGREESRLQNCGLTRRVAMFESCWMKVVSTVALVLLTYETQMLLPIGERDIKEGYVFE